MAAEIGAIVEGKVSGITNFGVFVNFGENETGMVHISEASKAFIKDLKEYFTIGQAVKAKVIAITPEGKISLSIKQAEEQDPEREERRNNRRQNSQQVKIADSFEFKPKQRENLSFEDMMSKFKQSSDEKMYDLKKVIDTRRGSQNRRSKQQ